MVVADQIRFAGGAEAIAPPLIVPGHQTIQLGDREGHDENPDALAAIVDGRAQEQARLAESGRVLREVDDLHVIEVVDRGQEGRQGRQRGVAPRSGAQVGAEVRRLADRVHHYQTRGVDEVDVVHAQALGEVGQEGMVARVHGRITGIVGLGQSAPLWRDVVRRLG